MLVDRCFDRGEKSEGVHAAAPHGRAARLRGAQKQRWGPCRVSGGVIVALPQRPMRALRGGDLLLPLALALLPLGSVPSSATSGGCGDAAADNHDPGSDTPAGDNHACSYSCATLLAHFKLPPASIQHSPDPGASSKCASSFGQE